MPPKGYKDYRWYGLSTLDYIKQRLVENKDTGCIEWIGHKKNGYGTIRVKEHTKYIHRFIYEQIYGELPSYICVCHKCDNPSCVNINHLFQGTRNDNNQDCIRKGRMWKKKHEDHPMATLTNKQVLEIRSKWKPWMYTAKMLAKEYNVTPRAVGHILRNETWVGL